MPHIGVIEECVHEPVQIAVGREQLGLEAGMERDESADDLREGFLTC